MKNKYIDLIHQTFEFPQPEFKVVENELYFNNIPLMDIIKQVEQMGVKEASSQMAAPEFAVILGTRQNPMDTFVIPFVDSRSVMSTLVGLESGTLAENVDPLSKTLFLMKKNGYNIKVLDSESKPIGDPKLMGSLFKPNEASFRFPFNFLSLN